jgi:hypothetical protein
MTSPALAGRPRSTLRGLPRDVSAESDAFAESDTKAPPIWLPRSGVGTSRRQSHAGPSRSTTIPPVHVLEERARLRFEHIGRVGTGKSLVENLLDPTLHTSRRQRQRFVCDSPTIPRPKSS